MRGPSLTQIMSLRNVVFVLSATVSSCYTSVNPEDWKKHDRLTTESWKVAESWVKNWVQGSVIKLEPILKEVEHKLTPKCKDHVWLTLRGLQSLKPWAVQMLDSWSKIPPGFASGVSSFFGDFDTCLALHHEDGHFQGQYCNVQTMQRVPKVSKVHLLTVNSMFPEFANTVMTNNTISQVYVRERLVWYYRYGYKFGICLPTTCTKNDVTAMAEEGLKELRWEVKISDCKRQEDTRYSLLQICTLSGFAVLFVIITISTVTDIMRKSSNHIDTKGSVLHFSLLRNWKALTESPATGSRFAFLDGIRAIVVHWTILLHTFSMYEPSVLSGCFSAVGLIGIPFFQLIMNAWVSVDTFFCISGFLLSNSLLRSLELKEGKVNLISLLLRRICRVSPITWAILGMMFLAPLLGDGPHWAQNFQNDIDKCKNSWLPVVLFANNWVGYDRMCLPQTWYNSCDMQLYVLGLVLTYLLYKCPNLGIKCCFTGIALSCLWLAYIVYVNDLQPTMIWETFDESYRNKMLKMTYMGTLPHLPSIIIGILASYVIHRAPKLHLRKISVYTCWTASSMAMLWTLLVAHPWHNGEWPTTFNAALYQGSHKVLWSMGTAWTLYACVKGYGGYAERMLSWSGFSTLGKLAFAMNMINIPVIRFKNAILRRYINFGLADLYYDFLGHYAVSLAIATLLYLTVEAPFSSLAETFLKDEKKEEKRKEK